MFIKRIVDYTLQTGGLTTGILTAHWASQGSHSPLLRSIWGKKVSFSHPKLIPATTHSWQILAYILHKCSNELNSYQTWLSDPCTLLLCTVHNIVLWPLYSPTVHCAQHKLKIIWLRIFSCSAGSISLSVKTSHESSTWQTCEPKEGGKPVFTTKLVLDVLSICEDYSFAKL